MKDLFNKTIFKQTFKSNWKLWMIFTAILCLFISISIAVFDPIAMSRLRDMFAGLMGDEAGETIGAINFTLTGSLAMMFFGMMAVVLPMIYILITANSLIASKVDRGSMAYTLSTPIKRKTVAFTQAAYLVSMIVSMFTIIAVVGLVTVQISHGSVFGTAPTADARAIARHLNVSASTVTNNLREKTLDNPDPEARERILEIGAEARMIDVEIYIAYLELKAPTDSDTNVPTLSDFEEMGVDVDWLASKMMVSMIEARQINTDMAQVIRPINSANLRETSDRANFAEAFPTNVLNTILFGMAAQYLELDPMVFGNILAIQTHLNNNRDYFVSDFNYELLRGAMLLQLATSQYNIDAGYEFDVGEFMLLMLGALLFALATAGISFFFSCFFNLSKHSIALGTGIPVGFYLLETISSLDNSLNWLRYVSMNTLFSPSTITSGGVFWWQFLVLGSIAVVLFTAAIIKFKKKDLPL
ncbi:MAG: hypothetical protein FWC00_00020 [Firmicutes bacterium]|nr:hypothetical protein [Bacillota bacterium]